MASVNHPAIAYNGHLIKGITSMVDYSQGDFHVYRGGKEWKHIRSSASKQIVPRRVANYAPGLCEIGDGFVEYIRHKRGPDGYLEDVNSALTKWAFQG